MDDTIVSVAIIAVCLPIFAHWCGAAYRLLLA